MTGTVASLAIVSLIAAIAFTLWSAIAYGLASQHPAPSQTTLIPQFLFALTAAASCFVAAFAFGVAITISWFWT